MLTDVSIWWLLLAHNANMCMVRYAVKNILIGWNITYGWSSPPFLLVFYVSDRFFFNLHIWFTRIYMLPPPPRYASVNGLCARWCLIDSSARTSRFNFEINVFLNIAYIRFVHIYSNVYISGIYTYVIHHIVMMMLGIFCVPCRFVNLWENISYIYCIIYPYFNVRCIISMVVHLDLFKLISILYTKSKKGKSALFGPYITKTHNRMTVHIFNWNMHHMHIYLFAFVNGYLAATLINIDTQSLHIF